MNPTGEKERKKEKKRKRQREKASKPALSGNQL